MIHLKYDKDIFSIDQYKDRYGEIYSEFLDSLENRFSNKRLGFYDLDTTIDTQEILDYVDSKKNSYENIVVIGIGGSALGTKAIFSAIYGDYYNSLSVKQRKGKPRLYVLDNVDPIEITNLTEVLSYKKTLFIVISKSGLTLETHAQYNYFKKQILKKNLVLNTHFTFVTGQNSELHKEARTHNIKTFFIPENVGGRFSVFTAVGLLPLAFVGIDIKKLLQGHASIKKSLLSKNLEENHALVTAIIDYESHTFDKNNITVFFPYVANLKFVSAWYKQLYGESLGKKGIAANMMTSLGVTDQHSDLQLYNDGPKDKLFVFLELEEFPELKISKSSKITFGDLMKTEKYGTQKAISERKHLHYTISLKKLDEEHIGALILFFEMQVAFLGELYNINTYDQPGVEASKIITKQKLKEQFGSISF